MEPPAKKMRMSRPKEFVVEQADQTGSGQPDQQPIVPNINKLETHPTPSRTIDLSAFRPRVVHFGEARLGRRANPTSLSKASSLEPRTPDVTVTATILNVAVVESGSVTQTTQVSAASSDSIVAIASLGPLTIPGIQDSASTVGTPSSEAVIVTSNPSSTGIVDPTISSLSSVPGSTNGTSSITSDERTVTVTATSNLAVTYNNGTFIAPSRSTESLTRFTVTKGNALSTITGSIQSEGTDDFSSQNASSSNTSWRFGDPVTSSVINTTPTNANYVGNNGIAGTATSSASASSSSNVSSDTGSDDGVNLTPQQQQVVGGVVGGLASVALVLVALLYFLKWYRGRLKGRGRLPEQIQDRGEFGGDDDQALTKQVPMAESNRASLVPILAFASRFKQFRPNSSTTISSSTTRTISLPPSETDKGFQKISGRKIPSVLATGGDGYGSDANVIRNHYSPALVRSPPRTSWFRDSNSHETSEAPFLERPSSVSEPTTPTMNPFLDPPNRIDERSESPSPALNPSARDFASAFQANQIRSQLGLGVGPTLRGADGYAALRPSPARTPVTLSPTSSHFHLPEPISTPPLLNGDAPALPPVPKIQFPPLNRGRQEGIGNSLGANDGTGRSMSRFSVGGLSARSASGISGRSTSTGGKFREEI